MKSKRKSIKLMNLIIILIFIIFIFFTIGKAFFSENKTFTIPAKIVNVETEQNSYDEIKPNGLGDMNNDGKITVEDALLIQEYLAEGTTFTEDQKLRADTNKDGDVDINDATYLQRYIELLNPYDKIGPNELGDMNNDGNITVEDVRLIQEYLVKSTTFTEDQKLRADTNKDGSVNIHDGAYLETYIVIQNPYDEIEANGLGDINDDGNLSYKDVLLIQEYLADMITFTDDQQLRADTNKDGSIDINDVNSIQKYIMEQNPYDKIEPNGLGDINNDGNINIKDSLLIQEYLVKLIPFTDDQRLRADTNKDGDVDISDATYLQRYIMAQNPYDEIEANRLGDINDDGMIDDKDVTLIQEYLAEGTTFTEDQKLRADTNKDGLISVSDVNCIKKYIESQNTYDKIEPNGLGDINDDGEITVEDVTLIQKYLVNLTTFTDDQKLRADTNRDGKIDISDATCIQKYIIEQNPYDEIKPNRLGDINNDGEITVEDVTLIQKYLVDLTTFTDDQKLRADTNRDGKIDISDAFCIQKYMAEQNPYDAIKPNGLGDINDDGEITVEDVTLIRQYLVYLTTFTEEQKLRADTNRDGKIDISDAFCIQKYMVEQNPYDEIKPKGLGDVNNDAIIDGADIRLIQESLINIKTFTKDQRLRADTNKDASVNLSDVTLLQEHVDNDNEGLYINSVTQSPTNWTNKNVTLIVHAIDYGGSEIEYSFDGGETWQSSNEYEVENNGTIEIKVKNNDGNTDTKSYDVTNIDKITPIVSISDNIYDSGIIILADDENGSGIASVKVNGNTLEKREGYTNQWIFVPEQNGTYTIIVTDQAGNTTTIEKVVDYIDNNNHNDDNNNNNNSGSNSDTISNSKMENVFTSSSILPYAGGFLSKIIVAFIAVFGVVGIRGYTLLKKYKNL